MGITLEQYRAYMGGRKTAAEILAIVDAAPAATHPAPVQVAQIVHPDADGWNGRLPYPPSLNRYYRHVGAKVLISREGRKYRLKLEKALRGCAAIGGEVSFTVTVHPPDRRRRDLDNLLKGLQDALVHAGLLADDSQIKRLHMEMREPIPPGCVYVSISRIAGKCV